MDEISGSALKNIMDMLKGKQGEKLKGLSPKKPEVAAVSVTAEPVDEHKELLKKLLGEMAAGKPESTDAPDEAELHSLPGADDEDEDGDEPAPKDPADQKDALAALKARLKG